MKFHEITAPIPDRSQPQYVEARIQGVHLRLLRWVAHIGYAGGAAGRGAPRDAHVIQRFGRGIAGALIMRCMRRTRTRYRAANALALFSWHRRVASGRGPGASGSAILRPGGPLGVASGYRKL
jgi:hypothetical protein